MGITTREVTEKSERISEIEQNNEFSISNAWLSQVENTEATPSIYKLYSLSVIYHVKISDLLALFGVDLQRIADYQWMSPNSQTHLSSFDAPGPEQRISFPLRMDPGFALDQTNLVSRMVELWGEIPLALVQRLDIRSGLYGYIGLRDYTLSPMIKPGAFVQIDQRLRKVQTSKWQSEFERPIYFVELHDGYACSWCDVQGSRLTLVPHPLSPCSVRQYENGTEAQVVGQVVGVAMRLVSANSAQKPLSPKSPTQS